jgi:repressor LexA
LFVYLFGYEQEAKMVHRSCADDWVPVPLLGTVAAGEPLEVFSVEQTLDVPRPLWQGRRVYALRVRGQSMIEAGIHDGDYLIVEPCDTAENGRTVVAEVDGKVTVKKLYREAGGRIRLQPANPNMLPFVVRGDRVRVRGIVVGILRKYGFGARNRNTPAPRPAPPRVVNQRVPSAPATLDQAMRAMDARLERWRRLQRQAQQSRGAPRDLQMARAGRDLQALRDWCARTSKPSLQQALINAATKLMQRMDRLDGKVTGSPVTSDQ